MADFSTFLSLRIAKAVPAVTAPRGSWQAVRVTEQHELRVDSWLTLAAAARELGLSATKVRQMVKDHELAMLRRPGAREPEIPAAFILDGLVVKGLPGTLTLLTDHGFDDEEAIEWLFAEDDSLPGSPIQALRENRGTEVRRRAQVIT